MKKKRDNYQSKMISNLREASSSFCEDDKKRYMDLVDKLDNTIYEAKKKLANLFLFLLFIIVALLVFTFLLMNKNDALESRLNYLEQRESLLVQFMSADSTGNISYYSKEDTPITYHQLYHENDSLRELSESRGIYIDLVTKNYPISLNRYGNRYYISSPKIDSALVLLDVCRDMVSYDSIKKVWIITRTTKTNEL